MKRALLSATLIFAANQGAAWAEDRFERVAVYLEQTAEDEDAEVIFEAVSGTAGLSALKVTAPDGRTVIDFKAANSKLGIRHLLLESPEPKNDGKLLADFPKGAYVFSGTLTTGAALQGEAMLSHKFPDTVRVIQPRPDDRRVPSSGMQIKWNAAKDAAGYIVVIEQEKTGREIKANLASNATSFTVADGFLSPGLDYKLAVGTVAKDGNKSFTEFGFATAAKK